MGIYSSAGATKVEAFALPVVELPDNNIEVGLRESGEFGTLGEYWRSGPLPFQPWGSQFDVYRLRHTRTGTLGGDRNTLQRLMVALVHSQLKKIASARSGSQPVNWETPSHGTRPRRKTLHTP